MGQRFKNNATYIHGLPTSFILENVKTSIVDYEGFYLGFPTFTLNWYADRSKTFLRIAAVLAKYAGHAGHVRQTSADVRQGAQTLPDILSGRVQYTENVQEMSGIKHNICWSLTEKNVRQEIKMSGRALKVCRTFCPADLK